MCDYSITHGMTRPAKVADKLVVHRFGSTRGFASVDDPMPVKTAVCVLPGTEIAFEGPPMGRNGFGMRMTIESRTATFRQIDVDSRTTHHDALEFSNGQVVKLHDLVEGERAEVLQLPARPRNEAEEKAQQRLPQTEAVVVG